MPEAFTSSSSADRYAQSLAVHAHACTLMPGGVSSPVRAYRAVGRTPVTVVGGKGAEITDVDGHVYVDYVGSYGPLILGHAYEAVTVALAKAAGNGTSFGMPTVAENKLAEKVIAAVGGIELVRFVNSGTEAAMSALRLARAVSGRDKIIKCIGCYHGHTDAMLVAAGSGATTLGVPSSPGVPECVTQNTVLVPYNNLDAVRAAIVAHPGQVAAVAVEPIAGNMGCIPPEPGYLQGLRDLCDETGVLLLFDEVMTGFRVGLGGAQGLYGVTPDITCLGKIVGGGLPCAAYGASEKIMRQVAPDGPVYQAGTLSGNPLAMAAGHAVLDVLAADDGAVYKKLEVVSAGLAAGLEAAAKKANCPVSITRVGSMLGVFFVDKEGDRVIDYDGATACHVDRYAAFFGVMLDRGVMLAVVPSAYETWFVSAAHDEAAIERTLDAAEHAFAAAMGAGG